MGMVSVFRKYENFRTFAPQKMKRLAQNSVTLLLAVLFMTSANGWNAVHFCCETCAEHGLQIFALNDCATVHAHHQHHEKTTANCCCSHSGEAKNGFSAASNDCSLRHISVDNSTMQKQVQTVCFLPLVGTLNFAIAEFGQGFKTLHSAQTFRAPPLKTGRTILSRIALLLI